MIGNQLSHFRITAKLGQGGMGEVYRAEDTRLGREVAIKVLPEAFVADGDRLARFEREAKLLASLNHPNIAGIHDVGQQGSTHFLVMELVPGETLAARIARGPLEVEEALPVALQIAEAMAAAHGQGIVHRDLKPGNVMLAPDGGVKVLDFGLARGNEPVSASGVEMASSPTLTYQMTQAGVLLGTAAYMSPEQAKGQVASRASDVWGLGCLLYEMLAGKKPFAGETLTETLAAVLREEPDLDALPADVPRGVTRVLRRCLAKNPRQRLQDAADVRLLLEEALAADPEESPGSPARSGKLAAAGWWLAAALALAGALAWWLAPRTNPTAVETPVTRFSVRFPENLQFPNSDVPNISLSPDGRRLAFVGTDRETGEHQIYVRPLDRVEALPVPGTEGGMSPFFSPDGESLAFFSPKGLQKVPVTGGAAFTLAAAQSPRGGAWSPEGDRIFYSPSYSAGLWSTSANGGDAREVVSLDPEAGERTLRWPVVLPGGRALIYTVGDAGSPNDYESARIEAYSLDRGERHLLVRGSMARFAPPNHLIFMRDGTLFSANLDADRLELLSEPVPVIQEVSADPSSGAGFFDVASDGTLAFVPGAPILNELSLTLVDRRGETSRVPLAPRAFSYPSFSPDGSKIAYSVGGLGGGSAGNRDGIWVHTLASGDLDRLSFDSGDTYPAWSPDGSRIAYSNSETSAVLWKPADGTGSKVELPMPEARPFLVDSWAADGSIMAVTRLGTTIDIFLLIEGEAPRLFEQNAGGASLSPDGRFVAYHSPPSGADSQIYVRPVTGDGKWQVSVETSSYAHWAAETNEIFYLHTGDPKRPLYKVGVLPGATFAAQPPERVLETTVDYLTRTAPYDNWDVSADGQLFVFVEPERGFDRIAKIEVATGWARTLATAPR